MTGRVLVAPPFAAPQSFPPTAYAVPAAPSPAAAAPYRAAPAPAQPQAAAPNLAAAPRSGNAPVFRGQIPDEPIAPPPAQRPREMINLPSPEELGVGSARADARIDWGTVNRRLEGLGATCFQMQRLAEGRWHVLCLLPTAQPNQTHRVEAEAGAKAEAIRLALEQAEQWAGKR
jgi:hypothetical protein